ncbi:predicted protein [Coccidioides posadasii str. Silveira]|uniref:Predicted protein n=1 Tax=Coccidioides posadasii (strain RMSCC 757 / Silveira) TaxID=443226 RepID=E9DGA3_COCPS|nr:predicted protein [Coccidioides posadasii str. Silveira]
MTALPRRASAAVVPSFKHQVAGRRAGIRSSLVSPGAIPGQSTREEPRVSDGELHPVIGR